MFLIKRSVLETWCKSKIGKINPYGDSYCLGSSVRWQDHKMLKQYCKKIGPLIFLLDRKYIKQSRANWDAYGAKRKQ